ncbi:MAG: hypothetical protein M1834_007450 [Cirrosporium novae-zelandiae]|nr:MAG: hypothetical protein M1834_007450 [Cirrosporium novae-zelandiae]
MELYGCGRNDDGYLGEPRSCTRHEVHWTHECEHNNYGEDMPYCPLWATKLKNVLTATKSMRILKNSESDPIFLEVDGHLQGLGRGTRKDISCVELAQKPEDIMQTILLSGKSEMAFCFADGSLQTLDKHADNTLFTTYHKPYKGREILHIAARSVKTYNPMLVSGAIAIVPHANPRTILSFEAWEPFLSWLRNDPGAAEPVYSAELPSPIIQMTNEFIAVTADGQVFNWGKKTPDQPPPPPEDNEDFEDEEFSATIFGGSVSNYPSRSPERRDYNPTKVPLPAISKVASGICYNSAISNSGRLYLWGHRSKSWPEVKDVNPPDAPAYEPANIIDNTGKPLKIVDAATGWRHVVALAEDGSLWSVGDGLMGELGIGIRQFGLCTKDGVIDMLENETDEEFAEEWQRMDVDGLLLDDRWKWCKVFCDSDCTFVMAMKKKTS